MPTLHELGFRKMAAAPSLRDHVKLKNKPMQAFKVTSATSGHRWSALAPPHRLAWSSLSSADRKKIDEACNRAQSKRVADHNKNYMLNQIVRQSKKDQKPDIDSIVAHVLRNPNLAIF